MSSMSPRVTIQTSEIANILTNPLQGKPLVFKSEVPFDIRLIARKESESGQSVAYIHVNLVPSFRDILRLRPDRMR